MPNLNCALKGWLFTVAVIGGALVLYVGTALIAGLLSGNPMVGAVASNVVIFVAGLFWMRAQWHRTDTQAPVRKRGDLNSSGAFWTLVAAALVLCWLVGQASSVWLYSILGSPGFDQHTSTKTGAPVLLMVLVVVVLAPMGEEMLMRGVAYSRLRVHMPPLMAALLTSAVFSLLHLNLVQIAATLPLGLLLAAVYEQTGRLAPAILLHVLFNLLSLIVPAALVVNLASLTFVLLGGVVLALLLARLFHAVPAVPEDGVSSSQESGLGSGLVM